MSILNRSLLLVALFLCLVSPSCATVADMFRAPAMIDVQSATDAEWEAWRARQVKRAGIVARGAVEDGALTPDQVAQAASWLALLSDHEAGVASLSGSVEGTGLAMAALELFLMDLDAMLAEGGAYEGGALGPRGRALLAGLAAKLSEVAAEHQPEPVPSK